MPSSCIQRATSFDQAAVKARKCVQRRTSFASVSVREYRQTIGDSPCCAEGAPIMLDWHFEENHETTLEEYERARQPFRRHRSDLILGVHERRSKLVESGVSLSEVIRAEKFASLKKRVSRKDSNRKDFRMSTKATPDMNGIKEVECKRKPRAQRRASPPLQKQMASRAA